MLFFVFFFVFVWNPSLVVLLFSPVHKHLQISDRFWFFSALLVIVYPSTIYTSTHTYIAPRSIRLISCKSDCFMVFDWLRSISNCPRQDSNPGSRKFPTNCREA
uniref:(northern house mosquito) hypothetical protein n=1 Tax=Culex pipiens TaxID=7175 RepID=A0A8D8L0T5_CULPI